MRRIVLLLSSVALIVGMGTGSATAAGHQFRGHIDTTATPAAPGQLITIDGHGLVSGLGLTSVAGTEVADPQTGAITGSATFTAANGDEITFSWADVPVSFTGPTSLVFTGDMMVTGGTGRLADRSGTVAITGGYDFVTTHGWFDMTGSIGG